MESKAAIELVRWSRKVFAAQACFTIWRSLRLGYSLISTSVIPLLRKKRQEDHKVKANLVSLKTLGQPGLHETYPPKKNPAKFALSLTGLSVVFGKLTAPKGYLSPLLVFSVQQRSPIYLSYS